MSKLSLKFLKDNGVCNEAYSWTEQTFKENFAIDELLDWNFGRSKLIIYCDENPNITVGWVDWFDKLKNSETYLKFNGKEIIMGAYQVFNPLTGLHTRYETEAEATAALIEIAKAVLAQHLPTVCQELSNENGDTCWSPVDFSNKYEIVKV